MYGHLLLSAGNPLRRILTYGSGCSCGRAGRRGLIRPPRSVDVPASLALSKRLPSVGFAILVDYVYTSANVLYAAKRLPVSFELLFVRKIPDGPVLSSSRSNGLRLQLAGGDRPHVLLGVVICYIWGRRRGLSRADRRRRA